MNSRIPGEPLIHLDHATIARTGDAVVLRDLTWMMREGETWAIVGPTGSGKTTLAETLLGRHRVLSGSVRWPLLERLREQGHSIGWPSDAIKLVSFREESWLFSYSRHYYQQRYNFIEPKDDLTLDAFLHAGRKVEETNLAEVTRRLGIEALRNLSLIKLSNGQMRRARIAKGLLSRPKILILDDPFIGLDVAGRSEVAAMIGALFREGMRVILISRPQEVPEWVTNVLEVSGPVDEAAGLVTWGRDDAPRFVYGVPDPLLSVPILELRNVHVTYGDSAILRDVTWTVRAGERWSLLGPNGSGKSTLLSLLYGDHPQAYGNDIHLFGRKRGSGESIWEIKRNIGFVSPELHLYFTEPLSAARTAGTGFHDVLVPRPMTAEQSRVVGEFFDYFGITSLSERYFSQLSTGEQRLVLLIRALVKSPPLLILDEPFQGLDAQLTARVRNWIDECLRPDQTLLFVSHYAEEIPRSVTRRLRLDRGQVAELT